MLWHAKIHEKIFLWRVLVGVLPTRYRLTNLLGTGEALCPVCQKAEEIELHLFKECEITKLIAFGSMWNCNLKAWEVSLIKELLSLCLNPPLEYSFGLEKEKFTIFFANLFYLMWNIRNNFVHLQPKPFDVYVHLLDRSVLEHFGILSTHAQELGPHFSVSWSPL